jgi:hypothetical protein
LLDEDSLQALFWVIWVFTHQLLIRDGWFSMMGWWFYPRICSNKHPKPDLYPFHVSSCQVLESLNSKSFEQLHVIWLHFSDFSFTFGMNLLGVSLPPSENSTWKDLSWR